jgi:hypothetical protein
VILCVVYLIVPVKTERIECAREKGREENLTTTRGGGGEQRRRRASGDSGTRVHHAVAKWNRRGERKKRKVNKIS